MRFVRVAVPVPSLEPLTYNLPDGFAEPPIGARVLVPLGQRVLTGVVVGRNEAEPPADVKAVVELLDEEAFLPEDVVSLALWTAEYYACGAGEAIAAAMPPRAWVESERYARITDAGEARLLTEQSSDLETDLTKGQISSG